MSSGALAGLRAYNAQGTCELEGNRRMVWFFARGEETVRIETRVDSLSGEYVLDVARPGGEVQTERFSDRDAFQERLQVVETELQRDAWVQVSAAVLPPAWRGPFTS